MRTRWLLLGLLGTLLLASCNTMEGFGRDVEKLGDKIEQKAKR